MRPSPRPATRIFRRVALLLLLLGSALVGAAPRPAGAHPMGNFTINHYSALTVTADRLDIQYVLDMAEIPAYQELGTIRADHNTSLSPSETADYTRRKAAELLPNLSVAVNGRAMPLTVQGPATLTFPPGVGGLPTLRFELHFAALLDSPTLPATLTYGDANFPERIGWKEIIAVSGPGVHFTQTSVPATDLSNALHTYPPDRINDPPRVTTASLDYTRGTLPTLPAGTTASNGGSGDSWGSLIWVKQQTDQISDLMRQRNLPLQGLLTALLIAFGIGAAHDMDGFAGHVSAGLSACRCHRAKARNAHRLHHPGHYPAHPCRRG